MGIVKGAFLFVQLFDDSTLHGQNLCYISRNLLNLAVGIIYTLCVWLRQTKQQGLFDRKGLLQQV